MTTGSALLVPATRTGPTPSVSTSPLKVLCILGHPRRDSLGGALHAAFVEGAREAGVQVQQVHVGELTFDPDVHVDSPENQRHESDIRKVQSQIAWADHLVIVYPTWWGVRRQGSRVCWIVA